MNIFNCCSHSEDEEKKIRYEKITNSLNNYIRVYKDYDNNSWTLEEAITIQKKQK